MKDGDGKAKKLKEGKRQGMTDSVMDGDTEQLTNDAV